MNLHLIFARARNGVIGSKGSMPWHLPEDLAHLKRTTLGCTVIMGRKTWDSLPAKFKPLPGRVNLVITRQVDWKAQGAKRATSLQDAIDQCAPDAELWVLGGAEIYAQAMPLAGHALVTEIDHDFEGDAYAPQFGPQWVKTPGLPQRSTTGLAYSFSVYHKLHPSPAAD